MRMQPLNSPTPPRGVRLRRHLRRWGLHWLAGAALLVVSEMLWRWQSWPVRELLSISSGGGA